ncbi:hypothetical protein [Glutamicibacter sp. X7]
MTSATVSGSVTDIVEQMMADRVVQLVFRLQAPNVQTGAGTVGRIYPTAEHRVTPNATSGFFSVDLAVTTAMLIDGWYELGIVWADSEGPVWDHPQWQIRVPDGGGSINNLITLGPPGGGWGGQLPNLSLVLVSLTKPDNLQVGQLWLQAAAGEHASANPALNTGKLYRGV